MMLYCKCGNSFNVSKARGELDRECPLCHRQCFDKPIPHHYHESLGGEANVFRGMYEGSVGHNSGGKIPKRRSA